MADRAYIDEPEELVEFTASTSSSQLPAAVSSIDPLYSSTSSSLTSASNQVLVTAQGEGVQIYSATDSKCLRSWTFPPSVRFACPAKYYAKYTDEGAIGDSLVYVALDSGDGISSKDSGTVVWRWTDRGIVSVGLEDKIEAKLGGSIFALEPGVTSDGHLLVVHKDGALTLATQDLEKRHQLTCPVSGKSEVVWYQIIEVSQSMRLYLDSRQVTDWLDGGCRLALVLTRVADADVDAEFTYHVSLFAIDGAEASIVEVGSTHIKPTHLQTQPLACAFDADTGTVAMLTEAGVYTHFNLLTGVSALDDAIILERTKEVVLRGFVPCVDDDTQGAVLASNLLAQSQLTMTALTERYVAIAGTHSTVSHASKGPYESVLTIWDLQFGCLHAEKTLELAPSWLQGASKKHALPRLTYQIQPLSSRLGANGTASEQISLAITVAHTTDTHAALDGSAAVVRAQKSAKKKATGVSWGVKVFVASAFLPPVTLLASLRLQNNAKYYVDPEKQSERARKVHSSNILLHEEQEQGLGVLRSGWEAIVDGTTTASSAGIDTVEAFAQIGAKREETQSEENEVLLALANVTDAIDSNQYTRLFMDHLGVQLTPDTPIADYGATWISAHLMTTAMRRCFAEPLGVSRSSQLPLYAPQVIEFMLVNCGLCNSHAPAPGLLQHLLARVDRKRCAVLASDPAWNLISIALRKCPDLPEEHVVEVLQFQLSHYAAHVDRLFDLAQTEDSDDLMQTDDGDNLIRADVMRTVSAIASVTGSDDMLRQALAELPLSHAACVLRLLITWMREWTLMGANVELAASARFVQASAVGLARALADDGDGPADPIGETIAQAGQQPQSKSFDSVPAVDAALTAFKVPQAPSAEVEAGAALVRVFTRKWAPTLTLPESLVEAPELGQVVWLAMLILDAHLSSILLSTEFSTLIAQLTEASDRALSISDQLRLLRIGLVPFHMAWQKQQEKRVADGLAEQKQALGLDEVVLLNGMTRSQAERQKEAQPNAKYAQGAGPAGTYWERIQKLEKYRVEVMHW
ncbi:hypothetical protein GGH14_000090 [Coemansia sp. RSA 370]|nr:hypothetical protein GGH14_000090 [Coemansia sp. RSA 370]KAJ2407203.1 hypothetical protein J3F80_002974 [Coemansia sp. RSA 2526]